MLRALAQAARRVGAAAATPLAAATSGAPASAAAAASGAGAASLGQPGLLGSCWWLLHLSPSAPAAGHARHFAKAAAKGGGGGAAAAAAAPAGPKRHRTSSTKLYSCRNDRLRHTHEQIWPTLQLTEAEAAMFRRNSRLFVVDMGRSMTLQDKFVMAQPQTVAQAGRGAGLGAEADAEQPGAGEGGAAGVLLPPSRRVPYQDARSLLHESQLHLDALGENPRYLRLRRVGSMHATKLQNVRKLRLLLGFQRRGYVQKMYEHSLVARGPHRMWKLLCAMEAKLPLFVTRMGLAEDVVGAVRAVQHDKLYVNGRQPAMPLQGYLEPGDVVGPAAGSTPYFRKRIARSMAPLMADVVRWVV